MGHTSELAIGKCPAMICAGETGGIIEKEVPLHISNVAMFNPISNKADRIGFKTLDDGRKVRFFKSDGEVVDI